MTTSPRTAKHAVKEALLFTAFILRYKNLSEYLRLRNDTSVQLRGSDSKLFMWSVCNTTQFLFLLNDINDNLVLNGPLC